MSKEDFNFNNNNILYRCAFVLNQEAIIWDTRAYQKRQHAYNRLEKIKDTYSYKYGDRGRWEVMYSSGWRRDNDKKTKSINTVRYIREELEEDEETVL